MILKGNISLKILFLFPELMEGGEQRWVLLLSEGNALQLPLREERKRGEEWRDKSVVSPPFQYLPLPIYYPLPIIAHKVFTQQEWMPFKPKWYELEFPQADFSHFLNFDLSPLYTLCLPTVPY